MNLTIEGFTKPCVACTRGFVGRLNKQTSKEIAKIQRKTRDDSHMMEELQKHVTARDSHLDIQLLKQKIAESQVR